MNDRDILRQASDNSDEWSDETWAAWGRLADQAHGRESVPALLAEVERLRAELAARPTRAEVLREALAAANSEHLAGETDTPDDRWYTYGVTDAARAIENLIAVGAAEAGESK